MNCCPVNLHAGLKRSLVRMKPFERRQQGWVDVDHPGVPARYEGGREKPHETCKADDVDPVAFEVRLHGSLERLAILAKISVIHDDGGDSLGARAPQSAGLGSV